MAGRKVLIVEDDSTLREMYKDAFRHAGFAVIEAWDGEMAVDVALSGEPNIVLLDVMMPKQGGLGTLRIMRTMPELKHIPVIILTALSNPEYRDAAKDLAQGYFLKTEVTIKDLIRRVDELLKETI
ncbi:MAG TPA: response regulator [Candidatus Saccharimonadales bacterium]|nr:response regulator [Candidatus Saccharimonadales bacterium]